MSVGNYEKVMNSLLLLPSVTLIATGRTGTDFLQSLLDSHPEVLTFNGPLFYHTFWKESACVAAGNFEISDFVDEFIGKHIEKLKSKYDIIEMKYRLGEKWNQSIDIDTTKFKSVVLKLLDGQEINSKNSMVAIYAAYAICLGQDIKKKRILFHHIHHFEKLREYFKDFPDSKIICMTRDPRANFVSGIEHWRKFNTRTDNEVHLHLYIKRILADSTILNRYSNEHITIRLEDLRKKGEILRKIAEWLNISYNECLTKSTWGGLAWHGDMLSEREKNDDGESEILYDNKWEKRLSRFDKYVLNYIMFYRLKHYGYRYKKIGIFSALVMPFLILLPLSYEKRFFSLSYMSDCFRKKEYVIVAKNFLYFILRICLFMKYYADVTRKRQFKEPFLRIWPDNGEKKSCQDDFSA